MSDSGLLVFTACYDERVNIGDLCDLILNLPLKPHLLVVDDNSPDGTGDLLDAIACNEPRLKVIHRPRKLGLGSAHRLAYAYAMQYGYSTLVTMDADFSHDPAVIPKLVAALNDAEFVIGSRFIPGGSSEYAGYRRLLSVCANFAARFLLGIPVHEFTTSFRAFRVDLLRRVDLISSRSQGYVCFMETVWGTHCGGATISEVPIHFADRRHGKSKIPRGEIFNGLRKLVQLFAARLLGKRWRVPPAILLNRPCEYCGLRMLIERYPRSGERTIDASGFQCTSMTHNSKPQVVQCLACGLICSGDQPESTQLDTLYADVEDTRYLKNAAARTRTFQATFNAISPHLPESGQMLEVGSYCGYFMEVAENRGWKVEGVEPSRWAIDYARRHFGHTSYQGTLEQAVGQLSGAYETIVMWDVLEHLRNPMDGLIRIHGLLDQDGVFCFSTLDIENWLAKMLGRHWPWIIDMHLYYFSRSVLEGMLRSAGFEVVIVKNYRHYTSLKYLAEKAASLLPFPLSGAARLLGPLVPLRPLIPISFGDIKLYVCRKTTLTQAAADNESAREAVGG